MQLSRFLAAVFLGLTLVLAQQASALHALSHMGSGSESKQPGKHHPAQKVCDQCLVFAAIDSAATPEPPVVPLLDLPRHIHAYDTLTAARPAAVHYRSRAPPSLS